MRCSSSDEEEEEEEEEKEEEEEEEEVRSDDAPAPLPDSKQTRRCFKRRKCPSAAACTEQQECRCSNHRSVKHSVQCEVCSV